MRRFLRNNGLSLTVFALFAATLVGQVLVGRADYNDDQVEHQQPTVSVSAYLLTGHFLEALSENMESEFLQMGMFVVLTACLFQKGSPESKDPDKAAEEVDADPRLKRNDPKAPWPVRRGGWALAIYSRSLSLAFLFLFLVSFIAHVFGGAKHFNDERAKMHKPPVSTVAYLGSSRFWFESFQNWQSEFFSIGAMVVLSIYLRQRGSTESKPVAAPHDSHGDDDDDEPGVGTTAPPSTAAPS